MKEVALKYHNAGLSVIPVGLDKIPLRGWKKSIDAPVMPNGQFDGAQGIGIVCGASSQGVEIIDVDLKYDITGTLMDRYKQLIGTVFDKVVVEKTPTGGYHFIYRTELVEGNQKLASRYTTEEERRQHPDQKTKVLLETRGQGGYFMCAPSKGYEIVSGDLSNIPVLTLEDRDMLINSAKALNEVYTDVKPVNFYYKDASPFDEYNERGDIVSLLQYHGWDYVKDVGDNKMFKRPGGEHQWSAGLHKVSHLFYVFTSSTAFEPNKAYSPVQVLCKLGFNDDWTTCVAWLKNNGYGAKNKDITQGKSKDAFRADSVDVYLESVRQGTLVQGLSLGIKRLDEHWRLKKKHLRGWFGMDNSGKTNILLYLMMLAAKKYGMKTIVYSSENTTGHIFRKLIEFYMCADLSYFKDDDVYRNAKNFVDKHFFIIKKVSKYTCQNVLDIADQQLKEGKWDSLIIDPYNSLYKNVPANKNEHTYDYDVLGDMREWIDKHDCSIDVVCHPNTEAGRRFWPKDHIHAGLPMPPMKAHIEGGMKFANRMDDLLMIHRYAQSKTDWMWNEIHVQKIKEVETGGRQTFLDSPVKLKMNAGYCGFVDEYGYDAMTNMTIGEKKVDYEQDDNTVPF